MTRSVFRFAVACAAAPVLGGCARPEVESRGTASGGAAPTVFTDSALFRRVCVEADSGLTPGVGRCTPRDQARYPERLPQPPGGGPPR
jgi:hypothetical protein